MLSKVGFPSVVSQTGRNLISPCQCWFSCLMKAKLRLPQPVIKSRLCFFFPFFFLHLGKSASAECHLHAKKKNCPLPQLICLQNTLCAPRRGRCSTFPDELNDWADVFRWSCRHATIGLTLKRQMTHDQDDTQVFSPSTCLSPTWLDVALSAVIYSLTAEPKTPTLRGCASLRLRTTSKLRRSVVSASSAFRNFYYLLVLCILVFFFFQWICRCLIHLLDCNPMGGLCHICPKLGEIVMTNGEYTNWDGVVVVFVF